MDVVSVAGLPKVTVKSCTPGYLLQINTTHIISLFRTGKAEILKYNMPLIVGMSHRNTEHLHSSGE